MSVRGDWQCRHLDPSVAVPYQSSEEHMLITAGTRQPDASATILVPKSPWGPTDDAVPGETPARRPFPCHVAVIGLGYVGLPTALAFHAAGHRVIGIDISTARIDAVRAGAVDLLDSDHARLATALTDDDGFVLTDDPELLGEAAGVLVCVPTPIDQHLLPDLRMLESACRTVVAHARPGQTIMLTSTTYVGCTRRLLVSPLAERGLIAGKGVFVAFSPERIDPGNTRHPQESVPRVVGGVTRDCADRATEILAGYADHLYRVSSAEAAEMTKLYENTFRAVNISLANEFADISSVLGLDIAEVIDAAATKPYGFMPFYPGPGVGGHCIPCDPHYLLWQLRAERQRAPMIEAAMTSVAARPGRVVRRAGEVLADRGRTMAGARILVVGVAYKPGVSDVRESPALEIIEGMRHAGASVSFTDPLVPTLQVAGERMTSVDEAGAGGWDLVVVHTVHPGTDLAWLAGQVVLDTTYRLTHVPERSVL
jgi:UDP-N-acetyl-D-glucosamine dehydrogenase